MKKLIFVFFFNLILHGLILAQVLGEPYFPETANGAAGIPYLHHYLRWQNPAGTIYNEIYLSYDSIKVAAMDSSVRIANGFPNNAFDSLVIQNLYRVTRYYWRIIEYGNSGFTAGPIWYFITGANAYEEYFVYDDFTNGLNRWSITGSACGWQIKNSGNTLPPSSYGNFLTASSLICSGFVTSIAEFEQINLIYFSEGHLEFNSDWNASDAGDQASVEVSTDQGNTWNELWNKTGVSDRNQHIVIPQAFMGVLFDTANCRIRFRTIQIGTNSWWSIDNVVFYFWSGILTPPNTNGLHTNVFDNGRKVNLTWSQLIGIPGSSIERKPGIPSDTSSYQVIGVITNGSLGYVDSTVMDSSIYTYRVWGDRYTNESTAYIFYPVPVELISFSAFAENNNVTLNWNTASEINNSGFEIERSQKSNVKSETWERIRFVEGKGTTTEQQSYSFIDQNLSAGKYQYRLKQIDFDGTFEYSNIVEVEVNLLTEFSLSQNYPNPFNPTTKITYVIASVAKQSQLVTIKVYDVLGNEVATLVNEEKQPGVYEVEFNGYSDEGQNLSSGVYFYQLKVRGSETSSGQGFIQTKKMIYLK